jgi:hypothetical protein
MSEPSGSKRTKMSPALGGPDAVAVKIAKKNARFRKSLAVSKTHRAAKRAAKRLEAVQSKDPDLELEILEEQIDRLESESDDESLKEFDVIQRRLKTLTEQYNRDAVKEVNKNLEFACSICMDNHKKDVLRIVNPCGHGFCAECLAKHMEAASVAALDAVNGDPAGPLCPGCRGAIADVITPYF